MENATKALTMAGGVLIAIIVIATLVYASSTWQVIPRSQDDSDKVRQLSLFNQQYESYARDALYGTDLISVLNKAIDNNERYSVNPGETMHIEINFALLSDLQTVEAEYKEYLAGEKKGQIIELGEEETGTALFKGSEEYEYEYKLSTLNLSDKNIQNLLNPAKGSDFNKGIKDVSYGYENGIRYRTYTKKVPDVSEFKTRIFKCTEYGYDSEGRINYLEFKEQEQEQHQEETT